MRVDLTLVRRVEHSAAELGSRQAAAMAIVAPVNQSAAQPLDGGALVSFGRGSYVNRAMGVGLGGTPFAEVVAAITAFYEDRGLPPSLELCPFADEAFAGELAVAGYRLERFRNVYAHDLHSLPPVPAEVAIEPEGPATAEARRAILSGEWTALGSAARSTSDDYCRAAALVEGAHDFVARADGAPAACGSLNVVGDIGWLGGAATAVAHRGRGLQSALLVHRLRLARDLGCTLAAATAVPGEQSAANMARLGFTLLYTQAVLTKPLVGAHG